MRNPVAPARSVTAGAWSGWRSEEFPLPTPLDPESGPYALGERRVLKQNASVESGLLFLASGSGAVFYKRFPVAGLRLLGQRMGIASRAAANWRTGRLLAAGGIAVPAPLAYLDGPGESWFLSEALKGCRTLAEWWADTAVDRDALEEKCREVARMLAAMHTAGVLHRDFKWGNVLVRADGRTVIADLDGTRLRRRIGPRTAARDLARFLVNGLELDLDTAWAHHFVDDYARSRGLGTGALIPPTTRLVRLISRRHQKRYGRAEVRLAPPGNGDL